MEGANFISGARLEKSQDSVREDQPLTLSLGFKVDGNVREVFTQKNWERAYNKHDNVFRISFVVDIKSGKKTVLRQKFVRKAALFWTRNPKIPFRIWVSVVKDDTPFYPLKEEEARSALFDINRVIDLDGGQLQSGGHRLVADISVSWGKHEYVEPAKINAMSNEVELVRMAAR
jgi:hypothetical protein